jgi:hypothetical protein
MIFIIELCEKITNINKKHLEKEDCENVNRI